MCPDKDYTGIGVFVWDPKKAAANLKLEEG
jgi:hypothetical protein